MRKHGIFSVASFIIGLPGEKPEMRQRALDLALEVAPDSAHFLPFLPLPDLPIISGQNSFDPNSEDIRDALELTLQFHNHRTTHKRLHKAVKQGGIRALLAQAAFDKVKTGKFKYNP